MPQQLIYTSSQRGVVAGRSGFCTVARSEGMREALMLRLEQLSYYEHRSLAGGREQPVCTHRIVDIRGTRFHVLSRIQDAGLDFTNRTNFLAHHLVLTPDELENLPVSPVILQRWDGWKRRWQEEPRLLTQEAWGNLYTLAGPSHIPAQTWARVTGDALNALGLVDAAGSVFLNADGLTEQEVLALFAESLEMLEARENAGDYRAAGWQITFTTALQEQDPPADFRWRCLASDAPIFRKLVGSGQPVIPVRSIRAGRYTQPEAAFARNGRQPLSVACQPSAVTAQAGDTVTLRAVAAGVPAPNRYAWYSCSRDGQAEQLVSEAGAELSLSNVPVGVKRYAVQVSNARGESAMSAVVTVSAEKKFGLPNQPRSSAPIRVNPLPAATPAPEQPKEPKVWTADTEEFARHLELVERNRKKQANTISVAVVLVIFIGTLAFLFTPPGTRLINWIKNGKQSENFQPSPPPPVSPENPKSNNVAIAKPPETVPPVTATPAQAKTPPPQIQAEPLKGELSNKDNAALAKAQEAAAKKTGANTNSPKTIPHP